MAKPFDTSTKALIETYPESWLRYLGIDTDGPVHVVETNLAAISPEPDEVLRVDGPSPFLVHIETQSSRDTTLPRRIWRYNVLLDFQHHLHVRSVAVLLRPEADFKGMDGPLDYRLPDGRPVHRFEFEVVRVWKRPVATFLDGDLGILPLAPLADVPEKDLPAVLQKVDRRLARETLPDVAATMMETTLVLAGMRLDEDLIDALRPRLHTMNITTESSYYRLAHKAGFREGQQTGREEGREEQTRKMVLRLGGSRFGQPSAEVERRLGAITSLDRLESLGDRLLVVGSWDELLAEDA